MSTPSPTRLDLRGLQPPEAPRGSPEWEAWTQALMHAFGGVPGAARMRVDERRLDLDAYLAHLLALGHHGTARREAWDALVQWCRATGIVVVEHDPPAVSTTGLAAAAQRLYEEARR